MHLQLGLRRAADDAGKDVASLQRGAVMSSFSPRGGSEGGREGG